MNNIKKYIKENKFVLVILLILFGVLVYTSFNTFLANDDLPYSFFRRLNTRVTNLFQVVWDNLRYYKSLNGRFLVHCIVMTLLIFGKNLWSVLNPLVSVSLLFIIYIIIIKKTGSKNHQKLILALVLPICYLLLYEFKGLIYWVAGSVNYLWVTFFLFIFIYLYLTKDINKKRYYFLVFILSTLHENSFVFLLVFFLILSLIEYLKKKNFTYIKFLIPVILGGCVLLLAPGNLSRVNSYPEWNQLSLFAKLTTSIPVVSDFTFKLFNLSNLVPTIFVFAILSKVFTLKIKRKIKVPLIVSLILGMLISLTTPTYGTFILAIIVFIIELFIHYMDNDLDLIPIQVGFYAVAFSMVVTPLYYFSRGSLSLMFYFIMMSAKYYVDLFKPFMKISLIIFICLLLSFSFLIYKEVNIYYHIGKVHQKRIEAINEFKERDNGDNILFLKTIPEEYAKYHIDANLLKKEYFTYQFFLWYYDLPDDTIIYFD